MPNASSEILQLLVDLPVMQQYYHVESRGDAPVTIVCGDKDCADAQLAKFGQAVVITSDSVAIGHAPRIEITRFECSATTARIEFTYETQGVAGFAEFEKQDDGWQVMHSEAWEN